MARGDDGDEIDRLLAQWRRQRPDLDVRAMGVFGRLGRVTVVGTQLIEAVLARHDLTIPDFDVLAALRRSGEPFELKPTVLSRSLMLSPAGMTSRLDRLERAGHVERRMDPDDRRSFLVRLSARGLAVIDRAVEDHAANENEMLSAALPERDQATLDSLLRRLLSALDQTERASPR